MMLPESFRQFVVLSLKVYDIHFQTFFTHFSNFSSFVVLFVKL